MTLFEVIGKIFFHNDEANEKIDQTKGKAEGLHGSFLEGIGTAAKWGVAITTAATGAVTAFGAFAVGTASSLDNIDKMSSQLGLTRQAYQELDFVMSQSGTSIDNLGAGMKSLVAKMDDFVDGKGAAIDMFDTLGVSIQQENGSMRAQEDVLYDVISAFQGMENSTEKTRLATELFGKAGQLLMPLLSDESTAFGDMIEKSHELGLVLGDDLVDNGVKLTDTVDQVKRSFGAIVTTLGAEVIPVVQTAAEYVISKIPDIQGIFEQLAPVISEAVDSFLPKLIDMAEDIFPKLLDVGNKIVPIIIRVAEDILPVLGDILLLIADAIEPILDYIPVILEYLEPLISAIQYIVNGFKSLLSGDFDGFVENITIGFYTVWETIVDIFGGLSDFFAGVWDGIQMVFAPVAQWFIDVFATAWSGVQKVFTVGGKIFEGIKDSIADVFKTIVNGLITGINNVIAIPFNAINTALQTIHDIDILGIKPFEWITTFSVPKIPKLYQGGVLEKGQVGMLEGDGAEAVVPLEQNTGWINRIAEQLNVLQQGYGSYGAAVAVEDITYSIKREVGDRLARLEGAVDDMTRMMGEYYSVMVNKDTQIVLNDRTLVGKLAPRMDKEISAIAARNGRV